MQEGLEKIGNLYDSVAKEYAEAFYGDHEKKPKDREILDRFAREIGNRRPVWDLGCGPGQTARYLRDLGIEISGLDLSEKLLDQARALNPDICFQRGNILDLDFQDNSIAAIVSFYAIVHFTEDQVKRTCSEVYRVLQPGGLFLFTYHIGEEKIHLEKFLEKRIDIDFMFFATEFISSCLEETGFKEIEIIEREPYPGMEYESRRAYAFAKKS